MPELPEVESQLDYLRANALGRAIRKVSILEPRIIKNSSPASFRRALVGRRLVAASRRGKYLIVNTDGRRVLVLHFGMGGDLQYYTEPQQRPRFTRIEFTLDNGYRLAFTCPRNICRVMSVDSPLDIPGLREMGPEPLCKDFTSSVFKALIRTGTSRAIKAFLMDQKRIAGIGNIYADQILFEAVIRPTRKTSDLDAIETGRLYRSIRRVLKQALPIASEESLPSHYIYSRDFRGQGCPVCGRPFEKTRVGGRTTRYCAGCQR
jgi:formamidopyrimidine-DNA glycosylase